MQPITLQYPVFEANQVLTNAHLNELFLYLDEQERLTRTNLIGIGIVCGLELSLQRGDTGGPIIGISRGCGISSEGYLLVEPEDLALVSYRKYVPPAAVAYDLFTLPKPDQLELWELFPAGTASTAVLSDAFIKDKVVLLFLELKKEDLRNCSAVDCNDKGSDVKTSLRRLLIAQKDLDKIIKSINERETGEIPADTEAMLQTRLNLPTLRLPRYDVPNTTPVTSKEILEAFINVFQGGGKTLVKNTHDALKKAYAVFQPVLGDLYPSTQDPFVNFLTAFDFLDATPSNTDQVRFLQYYYDLFDDLIKAYDEFRWQGVALLCACCPSTALFPRHLMLGLLSSRGVVMNSYRHHFLASSAISNCEERTHDLRLLFQRMVEMTTRFSNKPPLPTPKPNDQRDIQIQITPSKLGEVPISEKAIPYYYTQSATPPLYELWNPKKTRYKLANQNLGYHAGAYLPKPPEFVTDPLRFDLEPYNFFRIEGHLNKDYQVVLRTLLQLKATYRLPFDIIALRTGVFDDKKTIDLTKETIRFQDLQITYDTLRRNVLSKWIQHFAFFYDLDDPNGINITVPKVTSVKLLKDYEPTYEVKSKTFGARFESGTWTKIGYLTDFNTLAFGIKGETFDDLLDDVIVFLARFEDVLPQDLGSLKIDQLTKRFADFRAVTKKLEGLVEKLTGSRFEPHVKDNIDDRLESIIYDCQVEPFQAIHTEYLKRLKEAKQAQFLSFFLQQHPGIQHKAGVPVGGTFILVYHEEVAKTTEPTTARPAFEVIKPVSVQDQFYLTRALQRLQADSKVSEDENVKVLTQYLYGEAFNLSIKENPPTVSALERILAATEDQLTNGMVIADFYLPYSFNSNGIPIQYILPPPPVVFTLTPECPGDDKIARVAVKTQSGIDPFSVKIDALEFVKLEGNFITLGPGKHTIKLRDAAGVESIAQAVEIFEPLQFGNPIYDCLGTTNNYAVTFSITGGKKPYKPNLGRILESGGNLYVDRLEGDKDIEIVITDAAGCSKKTTLRHSCIQGLRATSSLGCTQAGGRPSAALTVEVRGGKEPYSFELDGNSVDIKNLRLSVGSHTLKVKDAAGQEFVLSEVKVPDVLTHTNPVYAQTGNKRTASFTVSGGTSPYLLKDTSQGSIINNADTGTAAVTINLNTNGEAATYSIFDSKGCEIAVPLSPPTQLPCLGNRLRCAYRAWLQASGRDTKYNMYRQSGEIRLMYQGTEIVIENSAALLDMPVDALNEDFTGVMSAVIDKLNSAINNALNAKFGPIGVNRLEISFSKDDRNPFSTLLIEGFDCEIFELEFNYQFGIQETNYAYAVNYSNVERAHGATFTNLRLINNQNFVPTFDCERRNLINNVPFSKLCQNEPPKPDFKASLLGREVPNDVFIHPGATDRNKTIHLSATSANLDEREIAAWIWDAPDTLPNGAPFFVGKSIGVNLAKPSGPVRLTIITKKGCFGVFNNRIDISLP